MALGSYEPFSELPCSPNRVEKVMLGLTMRNYKEVVQQFAEAYGREKSTVSDYFLRPPAANCTLMTRSLRDVQVCTSLVHGTCCKGELLIVAIGNHRPSNKLPFGVGTRLHRNVSVVGDFSNNWSNAARTLAGAVRHRRQPRAVGPY